MILKNNINILQITVHDDFHVDILASHQKIFHKNAIHHSIPEVNLIVYSKLIHRLILKINRKAINL